MAKLRKIQFYRNGTVTQITTGGNISEQPYTVSDLKSAYVYAEALFKASGKHQDMEDGEILLYRFSYDSKVHTLVGVVHVSGATKTLEVLANYDMLGDEITDEITAAINNLDSDVTDTNDRNDITVQVTQTDGKITAVKVTDELKNVAHTGAAADVSIADGSNLINATTVEGALAEIATEIDGMDLTATDVVALNTTGTALQAGKISETDGKIAVGNATTLVEFNQAISTGENGNKVATMADVKTAAVSGKDAIVVGDAPQGSTTGKVVSLKINSTDNVLTQDANGLLANIKLTYDSEGKKIKLFGKEGTNAATASLGEIDASNFIKDGMLETATIVKGTWTGGDFTENTQGKDSAIKLVWNTDAGKNAMFINAETLVDAYTAGNEWIVFDQNTNKISHKTQTGLPTVAQGIGEAVSGTGAYEETKTFKVPQLTVDAAGHVTAINEKEVSIKLPTKQTAAEVSITAIPGLELSENNRNVQKALEGLQTEITNINGVTWSDDDVVNVEKGTDGNYTISHSTSGVITTTDTTIEKGDVDGTTIKVPVITVNKYGHVTALNEESYTVKYPTVSGKTGQIVIETTAATETEGIKYTVGLAKVVNGEATNVTPTTGTDDYAGTTTAGATHKRVEDITVDAYGRVTAYTLTTVTEIWDCGTW